MLMNDLKQFLKTSQRYINILKSAWIDTPKKFFEYRPRDYEDRRKIKKVSEVVLDGSVQIVKWKVIDKRLITTPTWKKLVEIILQDEDGVSFKIHYLNAAFWIKQFKKSNWYLVIWKPKFEYWQLIFRHPEVKETTNDQLLSKSSDVSSFFDIWRIYPIYSEIGGIKSSWFAKKIWENLGKIPDYFKEYYPEEFLKQYDLIDIVDMVKNLHFPEDEAVLKKAKYRLWFDKLLRIQLISLLSKIEYSEENLKNVWRNSSINDITENIIGVAIDIYKKFWNSLTEKQYQKLLYDRLSEKGLKVKMEKSIVIEDNGKLYWHRYIDLLVEDKIVVELKNTHLKNDIKKWIKQLRSYLNLTWYPVGLLLNFWEKWVWKYRLNNYSSIFFRNSSEFLLSSMPDRNLIKDFLKTLPFQLTKDQKKAVKQIIDDFHKPKPMLRLLQWDVGSGKTIVAIIAAWYMIKYFWKQVAFLAPTEILAKQHYKNITKLLLPLGIRVELLVWSMSKTLKQNIKNWLKNWTIPFVVWTHALIQEDVEFKDLWFVIIDEQHRFWVEQRAFFKRFGSPHILQMTATPIPRSLALAFFWEFDVSVIQEKPAGRKPIYTKIITENEFVKLKPWILSKIRNGQQVYIITPLIEESDKMDDVKDVMNEYEEIKNLFPELKDQICYLHGKMKAKEKDEIMEKFKSWKCKILISTTVVEVWVDVPQATIIIIKNAERFGLAQLHQLRWRVWRSDLQSYCFLVTKAKSGDTYKRLKAMEQYNDWFKLAELDMQFRWAWEILWTRQSWVSDIPVSILSNVKFLEKVQEAAKWLLEKYPNLEWLDELKKQIQEKDKNLLV